MLDFGALWNTPSVDLSAATLNELYINMTKSEVASLVTKNQLFLSQQRTNAIEAAAKEAIAAKIGLGKIKIVGVDEIVDTVTNKKYKIDYKYGIPSVRDTLSKIPKDRKAELLFDETDNMDYENRYVSIDAHIRDNNVSDVSFFRIVKANDLKTLVFPPVGTGYKMPGMTESKFRQFILLSMNEVSQERMQIVETSDNFQLLFYGKRPEVLQIQGVLKNTMDNPWSMNMLFLWDNLMRGTKLAEDGNILQIYADKDLYSGYPFAFSRSKAAPNDFIVNFSFSFVITERLSSENVGEQLKDRDIYKEAWSTPTYITSSGVRG